MKKFVQEIKQLLNQARQKAYTATAYAMIECYWQIGTRIVEKRPASGVTLIIYQRTILLRFF